jgi:Na+/H+-dicarboxylate symporter
MHVDSPSASPHSLAGRPMPLRVWFGMPLFLRIALGLLMGVLLGLALRPMWHGDHTAAWLAGTAHAFSETSRLIMRMLGAVAPPLILLAVVRSLVTTQIKGAAAGKLVYLLMLNTVVAIVVGLVVANVVKPGRHVPVDRDAAAAAPKHIDPLTDFLNSIPDSLLSPLVSNNSIGVILLAISFGMAIRHLPEAQKSAASEAVEIAFKLIVVVLHWVLELVPLAVMCRVAFLLATLGLDPFKALAWFVVCVLGALLLQSGYYLLRVWWRSWVSPVQLLRGTSDALVMAFSTGSSVATMPLTYECMTARVGIGPDSASLGVLVGGNFNHDGTALYEAMSALFVAQAIGMHLSIGQQLLVVVTSMVAAVGAAGIPEAGLVTMTLVFNAVGLPVSLVAMLLPVDWFLDRCRTAINVMGDTSVACLLDGKRAPETSNSAGGAPAKSAGTPSLVG